MRNLTSSGHRHDWLANNRQRPHPTESGRSLCQRKWRTRIQLPPRATLSFVLLPQLFVSRGACPLLEERVEVIIIGGRRFPGHGSFRASIPRHRRAADTAAAVLEGIQCQQYRARGGVDLICSISGSEAGHDGRLVQMRQLSDNAVAIERGRGDESTTVGGQNREWMGGTYHCGVAQSYIQPRQRSNSGEQNNSNSGTQ